MMIMDPVEWIQGNPYADPWLLILTVGILVALIICLTPRQEKHPYWRKPRNLWIGKRSTHRPRIVRSVKDH